MDLAIRTTKPPGSRLKATAAAIGLAGVLLALSGCGGGAKTRSEVLRSSNPLTSDLYIRVRGPAGAVSSIAHGMMTGALTRGHRGFFLPPNPRHESSRHLVCSIDHTISSTDSPDLQAWRGKKTTISVYGNKSYAATYCRGIRVVFTSGF